MKARLGSAHPPADGPRRRRLQEPERESDDAVCLGGGLRRFPNAKAGDQPVHPHLALLAATCSAVGCSTFLFCATLNSAVCSIMA
jgi:hypothetical protein